MSTINAKQMIDENGVPFYPITHLSLVRDESGNTVDGLLRDTAIYSETTNEDGLYFVDEDLKIGAYIDANGIHSPSILSYQLIND